VLSQRFNCLSDRNPAGCLEVTHSGFQVLRNLFAAYNFLSEMNLFRKLPFENSANFVRGNLFLTFSFTAPHFVSKAIESHLFSVTTSIKFNILNENNFNQILIALFSLPQEGYIS
jgi:hypothetical protein